MEKLLKIGVYFLILNLLFGNSQTKEVRTFETLKNPRIFEQLLSEDYSKWEKEKNNVSPNLVSEKRGRRVLGSAYSLRSDLIGGMLDSNGNINVFKDGNLTATAGVSRQKGESEAVYYSNNQDITKGKTTYNNNPEVKVIGVDVKTKEIEGSVKSLDIISVQDSVNGKSRGYSVNVGIGFGKHTNGEKVVNGPYISSVGAGYSKSDTTQKITRNVAEFSAESGILEVKDKVRQVGSLIDGGFTLNAKKYEHEDLEDINKSKSIGINVTVYPNVTYTVRDGKGKGIYTDGHTINGSGAVYKVGVSYAEVDKNREVVSTIGSNVKISQDMGDINRDVNNQIKEFEGKEVRGINVDLGTEYWLTEAGRGKTRDIIEGAGRTVKSIKKILTKTDSNGELEIVKNIEAESALRKMEQRGFVEGKDKKIERVAKEIETKYGNLTKKGIRVRFYGEEDVDTSGLTEAQLRKLKADGIATTGDGYIWINKEKIKDGNTINFNKVVSHEITHQILGEDSEYEARYVESGMEEFLSEIKGNGYLKDGKIIDLLYSRLTDEDRARLNRYILEDMQFKDLSGGAGDRYTVVNLKYQKMSEYMRNASLNEKYSNAGKGLEEYKKHLKENIAKYRKDKLKGKKFEEEVNALAELEYKTRNRRIREEQTEARKRGLIQKEDRLFKVLGDKDAETALKYFDLDVNQRDNVVTSVDEQKEAYKEKYGRYPKDEYVNDKITFFTRNPELKGTRIVTEIPLEVMIKLMQTEIYPDRSMRVYPNPNNNETLWNFVNSEAYTNKGIREYTMLYKDSKTGKDIPYTFKVLDKRETASGLQAVTLWDAKTKETIVVAQGSNPGIGYPIKAPVASYGKVALGETVNNVVRGTFQAVPFPFNNMLTPVRDKMIADNNSRMQTAKNDIKNYQINMKNWQNDWIENNLKGNVNVGIWDGIKKNDVPITRIAKGIKNIVSIAKGEKPLFTPNQSIETEQYIREINSGKIIDNAKYGKVSIGLGHSLEGQGITYGTDRTNTNSIVIDPAPNNLKIKNQRSHLTLLSDSAILNKSEIRNGTRQHYTSFYGVTTSVGLGTVRVGMGVGATGVPVYQSKYHYTGDPFDKDREKKKVNDGHMMSEDFDQMRQEIETIDKLLVRPERWDK